MGLKHLGSGFDKIKSQLMHLMEEGLHNRSLRLWEGFGVSVT